MLVHLEDGAKESPGCLKKVAKESPSRIKRVAKQLVYASLLAGGLYVINYSPSLSEKMTRKPEMNTAKLGSVSYIDDQIRGVNGLLKEKPSIDFSKYSPELVPTLRECYSDRIQRREKLEGVLKDLSVQREELVSDPEFVRSSEALRHYKKDLTTNFLCLLLGGFAFGAYGFSKFSFRRK